MNIHTLSNRFDDLRHDIRTIEAWCHSSIKDFEERTTSAFATSVDMIDTVERIEEVEQQQAYQKIRWETTQKTSKNLKQQLKD